MCVPSARWKSCRKRGKLCSVIAPGCAGPERVERVSHRHLGQPLAHVQHAELLERALLQHRIALERTEAEVVRDQRMHPVDGDELLGERVGDAVVIRRRARDAADHLVRGEAAEAPVEPLALEPPPVRPHAAHRGRVSDDRRRPVDRVDLGHQGGDDEPRPVEELIVLEARMGRVQVVADRVVLAHEERMQKREPDPEVPGHAGEIDVRLDVGRDQPALVEPQLPVGARADRLGEGWIATVDLRAVPPVGVFGDEGRRPVGVRARILPGALDRHRVLRPRIVGVERDEPRVPCLVLAVAEPIVHLELDPGAGEQVERRRRLKLLAGQQFPADESRARLEQPVLRLAHGRLERDVAAEAAAEAAHQRVVEVVERPVERSRVQEARVDGDVRPVERSAARVVEVHRAQTVAEPDQGEQAERPREPVPAVAPVELLGGVGEERCGPTGHLRLLRSELQPTPTPG